MANGRAKQSKPPVPRGVVWPVRLRRLVAAPVLAEVDQSERRLAVAGGRVGRSPEARLRWLVRFLALEVERSTPELPVPSGDEAARWSDELVAFAEVGGNYGRTWKQFPVLNGDALRTLHHELRRGVRLAWPVDASLKRSGRGSLEKLVKAANRREARSATGPGWRIQAGMLTRIVRAAPSRTKRPANLWRIGPDASGNAPAGPHAALRLAVYLAAADLLVSDGWRLRRCHHCARCFVLTGNRRGCGREECERAARRQKFNKYRSNPEVRERINRQQVQRYQARIETKQAEAKRRRAILTSKALSAPPVSPAQDSLPMT